jgi:Bacterial CdiA-CT RNAse A domain
LREENAALEREQQQREWEAECAERKLRADIAWERFKAAFMRGDFAPRQKANFNPNQPRVAAGNADGGQWTGSTGGRQTQETDSAQTKPDPDLHLVQDTSDRFLNRHIIQEHVGKTDEELKARIRESQMRGLFVRSGMDRNGLFDSIESARDLISQTIGNNPGDVARVASGDLDGKFLIWRFGYQTGREAILDTPDSEIRMRPTYEAGVLIVHDPRADFGYRVVTAFPRNFNPRTGR